MAMRGMGYRPPTMNLKKPKVKSTSLNTEDMSKSDNLKNITTKIAGPKTRSAKPIGSKDSI